MKNCTSILILFLVSFSINAQEFKFEKETIDYGKINKGANGERIFIFTNIGNQPLIIKNIQSSCGCTVPKKPEGPIMQEKKEKLKFLTTQKELVAFLNLLPFFRMRKNLVK